MPCVLWTRPGTLAGGLWTLRQLRHSALTHAAEDGANPSTLLAFSGHTSVASWLPMPGYRRKAWPAGCVLACARAAATAPDREEEQHCAQPAGGHDLRRHRRTIDGPHEQRE
jgi:hypothetical protein